MDASLTHLASGGVDWFCNPTMVVNALPRISGTRQKKSLPFRFAV